MNCVVVGGGWSGCLAALLLAVAGHRVSVYEAGDALGGVLRDAVLPQGRLSRELRQHPITADQVVWCANPTALLQRLAGLRLQSHALRCVNVYATLQGRAPESPVYYQTFGATHPILRLFCYGGERPRITVEALDEGWPLQDLVAEAERVLHDLGWDVRLGEASLHPHLRYSMLTTHDLACIEGFSAEAQAQGIVTGGWQHYGRDPRLHHIHRGLSAAGLV